MNNNETKWDEMAFMDEIDCRELFDGDYQPKYSAISKKGNVPGQVIHTKNDRRRI